MAREEGSQARRRTPAQDWGAPIGRVACGGWGGVEQQRRACDCENPSARYGEENSSEVPEKLRGGER